jgi:hypothetical protein
MLKKISNWLPKDLNEFLLDKFLFHTPHAFGHTSHKDNLEEQFYQYEFDKDPLIDYLCFKLYNDCFLNSSTHILRKYINIQHSNMNGQFHTDEGTHTALYFPCPTNENGGQFEYYENDKLELVPYVQNQLIVFPARFLHRGMPFTNNKPRISLAFKIKTDKII